MRAGTVWSQGRVSRFFVLSEVVLEDSCSLRTLLMEFYPISWLEGASVATDEQVMASTEKAIEY